MARQAMILDLKAGTVVRLGQSRIAAVIGLSKKEELLCATGDELEKPDMVLELCRIKYKADGHWLIPKPNLPTTVNDNLIKGHILLNNGSVIQVGGRYMRYWLSSLPSSTSVGNVSFGEMTNLDNISISNIKMLTASTTFDPAAVFASITSLSKKTSTYPDDGCEVLGPDPELLQFLQTNDGLAHMTAAIVSQHIVMHTSLKLSAAEIDCLFLSFEHVTAWEDICFNVFLCEYEQLFAVQEGIIPESGPHLLDPPEAASIHSPVIHLLTSLLKVTLDPVRYNVLWLRILAALSKCSKSRTPLIEYKTSGAVLGCMAAKSDVAQIQEHGCYVLAHIANYRPPCGEKGPLKEGAVQIVLDALKMHKSVSRVRKNAVRFLGNITQTYARLAMDVVNTLEFVSLEEQRDTLVDVMRMLNFVEEEVLPVLKDLLGVHVKDEHTQTQIKQIMSYFQDIPPETQNGEMDDVDSSKEMTEQQQDLQITEHFNQTQDISEAIARVNGHSIAKDEAFKDRQTGIVHKQVNDTSGIPKNKIRFVTASSSPNESSSSNNCESYRNETNVSSGDAHGKSKTGMLAFVVRSSKKDKENHAPLEDREKHDSASNEGTAPNQFLNQSIIAGVELFSDEEDIPQSDNKSTNANKKPTPDHQKMLAHEVGDQSEHSTVISRGSGHDDDSRGTTTSDLGIEAIYRQKERKFVSEAALDEGSLISSNRNTTYSNAVRKKRATLLDKLTKKSSKLKKRGSILCTEYTQNPKLQNDDVQLSSSNLLYDYIDRPNSYLRNTVDTKKPSSNNDIYDDVKSFGSTTEVDSTTNHESPKLSANATDNSESLDLGVNVFRYVNIFCNMSKRKKFKDTASIASSTDSAEPKKLKANSSPESVVGFVKKTRRLFQEGRGKYDIAEAAIRASFRHKEISGLSYIPLSFEEHGHDCNLRDSLNFQQNTNL